MKARSMRGLSSSICLARVLALLTILGCGESKRFPDGKDTVESFGDGTWHIGKVSGGSYGPKKLILQNAETQETLVYDIADWRSVGECVYAIGKDATYAVLNFRSGFRAKFASLDEAPEEYKKVLSKLKQK